MVPAAEIKEETIFEYDNLQANELNLSVEAVEHFQKITARVKVTLSGIGIIADFQVDYRAEMVCHRCLERFIRQYHSDLQLTYVADDDPFKDGEKVNLKTGDNERVYFADANIDLSIGIREAIVLSLPIAVLCMEDCRGLCPICGVNKNKESCQCKHESINIFNPVKVQSKRQHKKSVKKPVLRKRSKNR